MSKVLPCRKCGAPVSIPSKFARAKGAVCSNCSPARAKATAPQKKFITLGPLQKNLLFGVGFYALFFAVMSWGAYQRCRARRQGLARCLHQGNQDLRGSFWPCPIQILGSLEVAVVDERSTALPFGGAFLLVVDSVGILVVVDDLHVTGQTTVCVAVVVRADVAVHQLEVGTWADPDCSSS